MQLFVYIAIIIAFTFLPMLGLIISIDHWDSYNIQGMFQANLISNLIIYIGIIVAFKVIKKRNYGWNHYLPIKNPIKYLMRIKQWCIIFCIIQFGLRGFAIFSGIDRGTVRVSMGIWGPLTTFIALYGIPSLLSLATVIYFFTKKQKKTKNLYVIIVLISMFVALMSGGKANIVLMMIPALIQVSSKLNFRNSIFIVFVGISSIVIIGTKQMNMNYTESVQYNMFRATSLATMGSVGVWNEYKEPNPEAIYSLAGGLGEKILSIITGISQDSPDSFKYNLPKYITYQYYPDQQSALEGKVNLTITAFGEAVYWGGHNYYFLISIIFSLLSYKLTILIFKTRTLKTIKLNILYSTFFTAVYIPWLNSTHGSFIAQWFGFTTLIYLFVLWKLISHICRGIYKPIKSTNENYKYYQLDC